MIRFLNFTFYFLLVAMLLQTSSVKAQTVEIDFNTEHQIIRGFGGIHINSWTGQQLNADMQQKAFNNNPGEIGLSIFRIQIAPDSSAWSNELAIAKYALSQGAIVFASPWNPPAHMRQFLRDTPDGTDYMLLEEYYDEYVVHLNNFIAYMERNGVPLYAISVQNEPDWHGWTWWEPEQILKFMRENAQNINCRVIAPESLGYVRKMIDPLLNDSVANSHIDILGTHLYGTPKANFYYPLAYEKNKEIWMTEHLLGSGKPEDNTWALAMELADEINLSMDARMSAFVYWYIRRFYGLINDSGNITDKGYVMSQFSKFIRPGAHRVECNFNSASRVNTTAYNSDSNLVVVVVNHNSAPVTLNFNINNLIPGIDAMTQFTTTETKRLVNDGELSLSNGSFTATVDAKSITTFTSDPSKGGKHGNLSPIASGGGEIFVLDTLGTNVSLTLKGSESTDPDGEIVNYSWARNGFQISTLPDIDVDLGVGNYQFVLTVTDNDGATDFDTVNVTVQNLNTTELWFEAECAEVGANWDILEDEAASNGKYLSVKPGVQSTAEASPDVADHLVYRFHVSESANYKVWGRVIAPTYDDDSFWIRVNEGDWTNWNGLAVKTNWEWAAVFSGSAENQNIYPLDTGWHTLSVCYREDGAALDKLFIANTGIIPSEMGGEAFNCPADTIDNGIALQFINQSVKLYPNPVQSNLKIESNEPFNTLLIYDLSGRIIKEKSYNTAVLADELEIDMKNGMYLLSVINSKGTIVSKFVVEK